MYWCNVFINCLAKKDIAIKIMLRLSYTEKDMLREIVHLYWNLHMWAIHAAPLHSNNQYYRDVNGYYRIVGFFEVCKFRKFRGCWSFVKFNPSKKTNYPIQCMSFSRPFCETKIVIKTENQSFAKFKYLTNYTVIIK